MLESLPPTLTRSLSDLKELDAVLSGSLTGITTKLNKLLAMLDVNAQGQAVVDGKIVTPQMRLELLREVAEEANSFKLGGEDKIRVATGTCETVCTSLSLR